MRPQRRVGNSTSEARKVERAAPGHDTEDRARKGCDRRTGKPNITTQIMDGRVRGDGGGCE